MYGHRPDSIGYEAFCRECGEGKVVPIVESVVERGPWRLLWRCGDCLSMQRTLIASRLAQRLIDEFDRAYGTRISVRETRAFVRDLDRIEQAFADELV